MFRSPAEQELELGMTLGVNSILEKKKSKSKRSVHFEEPSEDAATNRPQDVQQRLRMLAGRENV